MGIRFGLFLGAILMLTGCGPEQTTREAENQEMREITREQKLSLEQFEGRYRGLVTNLDGRTKSESNLILRSFSTFVPLPNRLEIIEIPNMIGSIDIGESGNVRHGFTQGVFDKEENTLKLMGPRTGTNSLIYMELRRDGNKLVGELIAGPLAQPVEYTRIGR